MDPSGSATIAAGDVDAGSNDACGIGSTSVDPSIFDCKAVGDNTVILTVTDVNGNVATDTATVTVTNDTPNISAPPNPAVVFVDGASGAPENNGRFEVAATDTQPLSYTWRVICSGVDQHMTFLDASQIDIVFPAGTEPQFCDVEVEVCDVCGECADPVSATVSTAVAASQSIFFVITSS